ncbi:hypothetical protein [Methylobacterium sp. ID0610]|uniref:hypothetical protein n=1 Tax=Methylobacterium carpenticola TaxID=3344827 RepID=UPI0036A68B67
MEVLLATGAVIMIAGAFPLFQGYKFMNSRSSEDNRLGRRGQPIAWDSSAG